MRLSRSASLVLLGAGLLAGSLCLLPADLFIGAVDTDMAHQFLSWRAFAAANLRHGHLPLWNPYTYSGQPFLAGFQSALFYPPNLLYLFLPLGRATNLILLAHLFILGLGMRRFAIARGIGSVPAGLIGVVLPLSGPVFPHLYAGHLPNVCTMAWTPWILAGLEQWCRQGRYRALFWTAAAVFLQIVAGQLQYAFYTAVAALLYLVLQSLTDLKFRRRAVPGLTLAYLAAGALAAAQLFPAAAVASETVRGSKLSFDFVAVFSLPPENFFTMVAPDFFGTLHPDTYWGRYHLWEMDLFLGCSSLIFIAMALGDSGARRRTMIELGTALLLLVLALGYHTPLLHFLYVHVPGFDRFRGLSKFTFPASIFLLLPVGRGLERVLHGDLPSRMLLWSVAQAGIALTAVGLFIVANPPVLGGLLFLVRVTREGHLLPEQRYFDPDVMLMAGAQAGRSLLYAGSLLLIVSGTFFAAWRHQLWRWFPIFILPLELLRFAMGGVVMSRISAVTPNEQREFVVAHPSDYRGLDATSPNNGFLTGIPDIWGDDPGLLKRYAEFIAFTQGGDLDRANQGSMVGHSSPLLALLRCRFEFLHRPGAGFEFQVAPNPPLPRACLIHDYRIVNGRDAILSTMSDPAFNPRHTLILESNPGQMFRPDPAAPTDESVRIQDLNGDAFALETETAAPALLLITDPYSVAWHAKPLAGSVQDAYQVLPADYCLRAIPLQPGHHRILMSYEPGGLYAGIAVSVCAWILWLMGILALWRHVVRSETVLPQAGEFGSGELITRGKA